MSFPTTAILDTFDRANGDPGANWTSPVWIDTQEFTIDANRSSFPVGDNGGYWNGATFGPDVEVYEDFPVWTGISQLWLFLRVVSPGGSADGYVVYFNTIGTNALRYYRLDGGALTQLGASENLTTASGDSFGGSMIGSTLSGYQKTGGWSGALSTRTDATYSASGYIGHYCDNPLIFGDNFGGGTIVPIDFPTTGILDDFDRADEGPPPSPSWTDTWLQGGLRVVTSECANNAAGGDAYWNPSTFGPNAEVFTTINVVQAFYLGVRLTTPTPVAVDGYFVYYLGGNWTISRIDDGSFTQLGAAASAALSVGDGAGLEADGSSISIYNRDGGAWSLLTSRTDSTYATAGYIGLGCDSTSARADDFGGGTIEEQATSVEFQQSVSMALL